MRPTSEPDSDLPNSAEQTALATVPSGRCREFLAAAPGKPNRPAPADEIVAGEVRERGQCVHHEAGLIIGREHQVFRTFVVSAKGKHAIDGSIGRHCVASN